MEQQEDSVGPRVPRNQSFPLTPEYGGRFHC